MLNDEQKTWVTGKMYALQEKYEPLMPLEDEQWEEMIHDLDGIAKLSKNNEDVRKVIMILTDYFEARDKLAIELSI